MTETVLLEKHAATLVPSALKLTSKIPAWPWYFCNNSPSCGGRRGVCGEERAREGGRGCGGRREDGGEGGGERAGGGGGL